LGIARGELASDAEIQKALERAKGVKVREGASILLIQSGALFPDGGMVTELSKHFNVVPFSGVPNGRRLSTGAWEARTSDPEGYSRSLRLAAARGGTEYIVCYWGVLESESDHLPTKTVSWVPVVHWIMPDENQHMRIRVKVAVVDVRSGNWSVFSTKPFEDARLSTGGRRAAVDQGQVERLKKVAYEASAAQLAGQ
jgi:hypothetical protein